MKKIYKMNYNSLTTIKQLKSALMKKFFEKSKEKNIINLFIDGRELKEENVLLSSITDEEEINLLMVAVQLTDDIANDKEKLDEALIYNIVEFCEFHRDEKELFVCITCSSCICNKCKECDHSTHKTIHKNEVLTFESDLRNSNEKFIEKLNELGLDNTNEDIYKQFRQELNRNSDDLIVLIENIKKKQMAIVSEYKMKIDESFHILIEFKDKIEILLEDVSENKKEKILKSSAYFLDFYQNYLQINKFNEEIFSKITELKQHIDSYQELFSTIRTKSEELLQLLNDNKDRLKEFKSNLNSPRNINNNNDPSDGTLSKDGKSGQQNRLSLINLMTSPKKNSIIRNFNSDMKSSQIRFRSSNAFLDIFSTNKTNKKNNPVLDLNKIELEEVKPSSCIANIIASSNSIILYDKETKSLQKKEIQLEKLNIKQFETFHSTLNYKNKLYVSGGYNSRPFGYIDLTTFEMIKLTDMISSHSYHATYGEGDMIYAISGFKSKKVESYNITLNEWRSLPNLNIERSWPSCWIFNSNMYLFGGLNEPETECCLIIEKLNLTAMDSWEKIELSNSLKIPYYFATIPKSEDCIYLIGGMSISEEELQSNYILNLVDNTIKVTQEYKVESEEEFDGKQLQRLDEEGKMMGIFSCLSPEIFYIFKTEDGSVEKLDFSQI